MKTAARSSRPAKSAAAASTALLQALRQALADAGDAERAGPMQAYMKSAMPYRGVPTPALRGLCKTVFAAYPLDDPLQWSDAVLRLWREAAYREERYAAIELSGARSYRHFQTLETLPLYEEMIVTGAWWDYVDAIATHQLAELLRRYPTPLTKSMRAWARSEDLWKRRSAILCQLPFKHDTDLDLLYESIELAMHEKEFFLRKAIGWALREYAKSDPDEVLRYVRRQRQSLSPLSKREALKGLLRSGRVTEVP